MYARALNLILHIYYICVLKSLNFWLSQSCIFLHTKTNKCAKTWKRACIWILLLGAIVVAVLIWLLGLRKLEKHMGTNFRLLTVSGLFFIKRHPTKYMHIAKNLTEKTSPCSKSDVKLACSLHRGRFLAWRLCMTRQNNGRKNDSKFDTSWC